MPARTDFPRVAFALMCGWFAAMGSQPVPAQDLSAAKVKASIDFGVRFLISAQERDGSWPGGGPEHEVGVTSCAILALINCGQPTNQGAVQQGLTYLRKLNVKTEPKFNYDASLMLMALAAAKDPNDLPRITALAQRLESGQSKVAGDATPAGGWSYNDHLNFGGDPSNSQYAILALREAAEYGVPVSRAVWTRAREYWEKIHNGDGGWGYGKNSNSTGSMTVAGISSLTIAQQMLMSDEGVSPDGKAPCCNEPEDDRHIERGIRWLSENFHVRFNPKGNTWLLYYLYGLERAGRLSGQRFFDKHDWYREGASFLLEGQSPVTGHWVGNGQFESHPTLGTSFALLFLSKGMAPVLINKLKYGPKQPARPLEIAGRDWNRHPRDVRNLVDSLSGMKGWPALLTTQELDLPRAADTKNVDALLQAPVLYITGQHRPEFTADELKILKDYVQNGGFIFGVASCRSDEFEAGFKEFIKQILPPGENELKVLPPEHPVFRSEYNLQGLGIELWGTESGCRTAVMYCADDLGCYWQYASKQIPPNRNPNLTANVLRATKVGTNVIAYATGREILNKLEMPQLTQEGVEDQVERGLLQIAQIRHAGAWNAAPRALRNLLTALNQTTGLPVQLQPKDLLIADSQVYNFPLIYMHGRQQFQFNQNERARLKQYLENGGVLFADSCCGAKLFDKSFREMLKQTFPDQKLERIPLDHELFSETLCYDCRKLKRRIIEGAGANAAAQVREMEAVVEGLELDGRYAVIYSKFDLSCALERQSTIQCEGYTADDAVKLATNIVLYSIIQDYKKPAAAADAK